MHARVRSAVQRALGALPAAAAVRMHYFAHHRRWPDLAAPRRFTEKIIHRKLTDRDPRLPLLADKISAKAYVECILGPSFVTPTLWSGDRLPPREQRDWPIPYVLKANHRSGANIFVRQPSEADWDAIEPRCAAWLEGSHASWAGEWAYGEITPKLLVEPYFGAPDGLPPDYKLLVFDGVVRFVEVDTDRETSHKRTFFDRDWRAQTFSLGYPIDPRALPQPASLGQMIAAAERLADGFAFVRIDFYDLDGAPRFGEMTFYPDSGVVLFSPDRFDLELGALWT